MQIGWVFVGVSGFVSRFCFNQTSNNGDMFAGPGPNPRVE